MSAQFQFGMDRDAPAFLQRDVRRHRDSPAVGAVEILEEHLTGENECGGEHRRGRPVPAWLMGSLCVASLFTERAEITG